MNSMAKVEINYWQNRNLLAKICGVLVIVCSLATFLHYIYPIVADSSQVVKNINNLKFDLSLIIEEIAAYILLVLGIALPGRSRSVWVCSIIILLFIFINTLIGVNVSYHTPLILVTMIFLIINYKTFDQQLYLSYGFVFVFAFIIFALIYGTFGSYLLRSQFSNLSSLSDAFYFTIVTFSTVGYGDIYPLTEVSKNFVISMIVMGLVMFTSGVTLIAYSLNSKIKNVLYHLNRGKISMTNHVVFVGYGILAKILIERYRKSGEQYLVIDSGKNMDTDRQLLQEQDKLMISPYPGNKEALIRARVDEAKIVIISFDQDSETVFAVMNVAEFLGEVTPRPKIIARVSYAENIAKAKVAGADEVVAPHLMAADRIMSIEHDKI
jgi:voltage-gated potassium channel